MNKTILFGDHTDNLEREIISTQIIKGGQAIRFADGEAGAEVVTTLPQEQVYIVQSLVNDQAIMALLLLIDMAKRAGIKNITAVISYYGYARQDREVGAYSPVSAKLLAQLLETAGLHRVLVLDLHNEVIKSFFNIPATNLLPADLFVQDITQRHKNLDDVVIVAPDVGAVKRAKQLAEGFKKSDVIIINKHRSGPGVSEVMNIIGDVRNKTCIITDDIVDSAGTLCNAAHALKQNGAKCVDAYITHGVFAGQAAGINNEHVFHRIDSSALDRLVITNSTNLNEQDIKCSKLKIISVAKLLVDAIEDLTNK